MLDEDSQHIRAIKTWLSSLKKWTDGLPAKGTVAGALHLLERLKSTYVLEIDSHRTKGASQIAGLSADSIRKILGKFGENRPFSKIGGRTNRGGAGDLIPLLATLRALELHSFTVEMRTALLTEMQEYIAVKFVPEFFNRKRIEFVFDPSATTAATINAILSVAIKQKKAGPVAEHLVGAKLKLRHPGKDVRNKCSSSADDPSGEPGDFRIEDTVFHVSMAPTTEHWNKCERNLADGLRVYMLVPDAKLAGSRQNAESHGGGRIAVESIESFVATNVDEISEYSKSGLVSGLRRLIELYNERVAAVEMDRSLQIEIPTTLN